MTFAWNADDVAKVFRSFFEPGIETYKYIDIPNTNYASSSYDKVTRNGRTVGLSMFAGYSYNERSYLSLGVVDPDVEVGEVLDTGLGRAGRRDAEDHGGAAPADGNPGQGVAGAVFAGCAGELRRRVADAADGLTEQRFTGRR